MRKKKKEEAEFTDGESADARRQTKVLWAMSLFGGDYQGVLTVREEMPCAKVDIGIWSRGVANALR